MRDRIQQRIMRCVDRFPLIRCATLRDVTLNYAICVFEEF